MVHAEAQNFEQEFAFSFDLALQLGPYAMLSPKTRKVIIEILFALKEQNNKVRLSLVTLIGVIEGTLGEDGFIGLEMQAANAIKAKQFV